MLVVPVVAMESGFIPLFTITVIMALLAYYTAWIIVAHKGTSSGMKQMMENHFGRNSVLYRVYSFSLIISIFTLIIINFELLMRQSIGLLPQIITIKLEYSFALFAFLLSVTTMMKNFNVGAKFLAFGILATFCLCIFFLWMITSQQDEGVKTQAEQSRPFGTNFISLISILITANSIHNVISPILEKGVKPESYSRVVKLAFLGSGLIYLLAGFSCVGISLLI